MPVGTWLELVANVPVGGTAGFYETVRTNKMSQKYRTYQFCQGYNTMNFNADQVGRHMLYFVANNQPSNVVNRGCVHPRSSGSSEACAYDISEMVLLEKIHEEAFEDSGAGGSS